MSEEEGASGGGEEPQQEFSSYEIKVISETFKMFDRDGSGVIDIKEMTNVLGELNVTHNDETIRMMFTNMDEVNFPNIPHFLIFRAKVNRLSSGI